MATLGTRRPIAAPALVSFPSEVLAAVFPWAPGPPDGLQGEAPAPAWRHGPSSRCPPLGAPSAPGFPSRGRPALLIATRAPSAPRESPVRPTRGPFSLPPGIPGSGGLTCPRECHAVTLPCRSALSLGAERLHLGLPQAPSLSSGSSPLSRPGQAQPQAPTGRAVGGGGGELGTALILKPNFSARTSCLAM